MSKIRMACLITLVVLVTSSPTGPVSAGTNIWTGNGPGSTDVRVQAIDPMTSTTLYAGMVGGGVFKSTNALINVHAHGILEGGSISGTVVAESSGLPLAHITIAVVRASDHQWNWYACTDGDGKYTVSGIPYGDYKVWAWSVNTCSADLNYQQKYWHEKFNWNDADVITIASSAADVNNIDFSLEAGGMIMGHVHAVGGLPVPSARVYALDSQFRYVKGVDLAATGTYYISGLARGDYYVFVDADGFGGVYWPGGYDDLHADVITVIPPNYNINIDFELSPEATATGFVYQSDGVTPISNVRITTWPQNGGQVREAFSNTDGSYTIHGLSTGSYVAKAEATDFVNEFYLNAINLQTATAFNVVQPQNTNNINFTLSRMTQTAEVTRASGGSLVYTDTTGSQTSIQVPPGAVTTPISLEYTSTQNSSTPPNLVFAGKAFKLEALQGGQPLENYVFQSAVKVMINYTDQDVLNLDENSLVLYYWNEAGNTWVDAATSCTPSSSYDRHPGENWMAVPICHVSQFSLFGELQYHIFLPLIKQ